MRFIEMILTHYDQALSFYGIKLGVRQFRKHINHYLKHVFNEDCLIRKRLLSEDNPKLVNELIRSLIRNFDFEKKSFYGKF